MVMNFSKAYSTKQLTRVLENLNRIVARPDVKDGRKIPNKGSLGIHDGRRLEATVMFLDISSFSKIPAWTPEEQETLLRILSLFFSEMGHIIEDHSGVIEKNTGDGLMAYFANEPNDSRTVQHRALHAALTMFYAADNIINPILAQAQFAPIKFRICMDHGPITVAKLGAAKRFNGIVAIGTTANIASKMLANADPDTILIGTKMAEGLPEQWVRNFLSEKTSDSGWFYRENNLPYKYWEYSGRWKEPQI